jgi:LemA protein
MKKALPWIIVLGILAIIVLWVAGMYNGFVAAEEEVESAWSQVENQYQRRADLVPNLVATVKGYAAHEQETLEGVIEARAKATQVTIDPAKATPEQLAAFQAAQGELSQALGRLLAVAENYPDLKANENFRDLQAQLEGTENRITVARQLFNESARNYNTKIRRFPNNILAGMCGFEKKPYFEAEEGASKAPKVEF